MENDLTIEFLKSKIDSLEQKSSSLANRVKQGGTVLIERLKAQDDSYQKVESGYIKLKTEAAASFDNLAYELKVNIPQDYFYPKIEQQEETIRRIVEEGKSLSCFHDSELALIANVSISDSQMCDPELGKRLLEIIKSDVPNLLIGIPDFYGSLAKYTGYASNEIRNYLTYEIRNEHQKLFDRNRVYSNSYITRFYEIYKDKNTDAPEIRLNLLKQIWDKRSVIIIEGVDTNLGVGNDLFGNVSGEAIRILAPETDDFDKYNQILGQALEVAKKDTLFLLAVGQSSTVLAYDLTKNGYQAIDVRHIGLEYEKFLSR